MTFKQRAWINAYLTHFNKSQAAKDAGYKCNSDQAFRTIGNQNFTKLYKYIEKWVDEIGLSDTKIKLKIAEGMEAKETKFFAFQGKVVDQIDVEALGIQKQYAEMAAKVKGLFAPIEIRVKDLDSRIDKLISELAGLADSGETPTD